MVEIVSCRHFAAICVQHLQEWSHRQSDEYSARSRSRQNVHVLPEGLLKMPYIDGGETSRRNDFNHRHGHQAQTTEFLFFFGINSTVSGTHVRSSNGECFSGLHKNWNNWSISPNLLSTDYWDRRLRYYTIEQKQEYEYRIHKCNGIILH